MHWDRATAGGGGRRREAAGSSRPPAPQDMSGVRAPGEAEEKTAGLTGEVPAASRKQPRRQAAGCQALPDYISLAERDDRGPRRSGGGLERPAAKARYFEATRGVKRGRVVERQRGDSDDEEPWRPKPKLAREAPCAASVAKAKVAEGAGTTAAKPAGGPESASSDSSDSSDAGDEAPDEGPGDRSIPALYRGERNASRRAQLVRAQVREHAGEDVRMDIPAQETLDFIHLDFSVQFSHQLQRAVCAEVRLAKRRSGGRRRRRNKSKAGGSGGD